MKALLSFTAVVTAALCAGCGSSSAPPAPTPACEQACEDGIALYALRQTMRLVYNEGLTGGTPGAQDAGAECLTGTATVSGVAVPDGGVGSVGVSLAYDFQGCEYLAKSSTPGRCFDLTFTGAFTETGTLAVQGTATMALEIDGAEITITGTVNDPPIDYVAPRCSVSMTQNGNDLSGTICGRTASASY
jgi:hypothetical protein